MKAAFKLGAKVRFKLKDGTLGARAKLTVGPRGAMITTDSWPQASHYMGEGWYHVTTANGRNLIANEDDLVLDED